MTDKEADTVVVVPDDPEQPATTPAAPPPNVATEDELSTLKARLATTEARANENQQRADAAVREVTVAKSEHQKAVEDRLYAQDAAVANALVAAQGEIDTAKADFSRALTEGKADEAADAQVKLAKATGKLQDAERQKGWVEQQKAEYAAQLQDAQRRATERPVPVQPQVSSKSQAWIAAHPRFQSDATYRDAAIGAHNLAKMRGIQLDTDEYFEFIEEQLGERQPVEAEPDQRRQTRMVAAPPSRSTPTPQRQNERRLTLTPQEREMADVTMSRIKDPAERYKQYAQNKLKMLADNPLVHMQ